ncbi:peptide-binding protein [soil metagenome]
MLLLALVTSVSTWILLPRDAALTAITPTTQPEALSAYQTMTTTQALTDVAKSNPFKPNPPPVSPLSAKPTPQKGGILRQAVDQDADTLNPLLTANRTSQLVADQLFPSLLGIDAQTGLITTTELAESWTVTDSGPAAGRVYTFHLRHTIFWSDGQPVTAQDVKFTYAALANPAVQSPFRDNVEQIEKLETPDAQTVIVTFRTGNCAAPHLLHQPLLPSHHYAADFSDIQSNPLNQAPTVSAGPFLFEKWTPGSEISLKRNPLYWQGAPLLDGWRFDVIADAQAQLQGLFGGRLDLIQVKPALVKKLAFEPTFGAYRAPSKGYSFIALNLADPTQPQPGQDADGALIAQASHPILGDLRVRQALSHALDYTRIISDVYPENGERVTSYLPPSTPWTQDSTLQPPAFDPTAAQQLLDQAGWVDENQDGIREKAGLSLTLTLLTNNDSPPRVRIGELVQEQLKPLGFDIHFQAVDFAQLRDTLLNQTYDMVIIGWDNVGPDPATSNFWHSRADTPGTGTNFVSFQDAEVDQWLDEADQWPGCSVANRTQRYRQIQQRLAELTPYIFIGSQPTTWAFTSALRGQLPGPWRVDNQVQAWWMVK